MTAPPSALRAQLAEVVASAPVEVRGLATGIDALDAALPARGIPRGRLTEVVGGRGSGKTAWLRRLVERTVAGGLWVAYVDASRTLAPPDWAGSGEGLWIIRPPAPARGAWCADVLLRSGAFALVVLDGAPPLSRGVAVRLTRLAREAGAALVVVGEDAGRVTAVPGALRLRVERGARPSALGPRRDAAARRPGGPAARPRPPRAERCLTILVEKGGRRQRVEVSYGVAVASRLCTHPEVADRRGVGGAGRHSAHAMRGRAAPARTRAPAPSRRPMPRAEGRGHPSARGHPAPLRAVG